MPASILKLFTALVALHYLGPEYRFTTEFYLDREANLKIKGLGDPLLISEVVADISRLLAAKLNKSYNINNLILDNSYYQLIDLILRNDAFWYSIQGNTDQADVDFEPVRVTIYGTFNLD